MPSYFRNTPRGEAYIYKLCNEDDVKNEVELPLPKIKNNVTKMEKIPLWSRFTKFRNLIMP